jgi:hypothetical protein
VLTTAVDRVGTQPTASIVPTHRAGSCSLADCLTRPSGSPHEATVSKVGESQLFYLMSRGLTEDQATAMIVAGFIEPIVKELPMEYAVEMNRLIEINMAKAGAVG